MTPVPAQPVRAVISSSTFPLEEGDALPRFVFDLANTLAERCEIYALVPDAPGLARRTRMGKVAIERFTYFLPRPRQDLAYGHGMLDNLQNRPRTWFQAPFYVLSLALAAKKLAKRRQVHIVNSHWLVPQGLAIALARGRQARFRHVLSVHAADVYLLARMPFGRRIARYVIRRSDAVFADGTHVSSELDRLLGYPARAIVQPMGADLDLFRAAANPSPGVAHFPGGYLLFFGRLSEKKGLTYLLRALPQILEHHPDLGLVVIGYGALEQDLRDEVSRLGLEKSVRFVGSKTHPEIASYLQASRLAIVPSIVDSNGDTEGMPTVVIEAMAAGTRVVASAVDGIPDVISHGVNGWLCRQKDPADLAEKVLGALADPAGSVVEENIRLTADRFSWPTVAERYHQAFLQILGAPLAQQEPGVRGE